MKGNKKKKEKVETNLSNVVKRMDLWREPAVDAEELLVH